MSNLAIAACEPRRLSCDAAVSIDDRNSSGAASSSVKRGGTRDARVKPLCTARGVRVIYLPPYSHDFHPI